MQTTVLFTRILAYFLLVSLSVTFFQCAQDNVFSEEDGTLRIDSISPANGVAGTKVRIYGNGFSIPSDANEVTIAGIPATIDSVSIGSILITVTPNVTTGPVRVTSGGQTVEGPVFTVIDPPSITSMTPMEGFAGFGVSIKGQGFDQVSEVKFNGVVAAITQRSPGELIVTAPVSTTGNVTLTYNGGIITGPVFTYWATPLIQNVEVIYGRTNYLHITGLHFNKNPSTLKVYLMNEEVAIVDQLLDPEPSHLLILAPEYNTSNPFQIVVESNGVKSNAFTFTMPPNMYTFNFQQGAVIGNDISYTFTIEGEYFGAYDNIRSVQIRHSGTGQVLSNQISSWAPQLITGSFLFAPGSLGPNDYYIVTVIVNGVSSNEEQFIP